MSHRADHQAVTVTDHFNDPSLINRLIPASNDPSTVIGEQVAKLKKTNPNLSQEELVSLAMKQLPNAGVENLQKKTNTFTTPEKGHPGQTNPVTAPKFIDPAGGITTDPNAGGIPVPEGTFTDTIDVGMTPEEQALRALAREEARKKREARRQRRLKTLGGAQGLLGEAPTRKKSLLGV